MRTIKTYRCTCCNAPLQADTDFWLELNGRTGLYAPPGKVPQKQSQGGFPFCEACYGRVVNALGDMSAAQLPEEPVHYFALGAARTACLVSLNALDDEEGVVQDSAQVTCPACRKSLVLLSAVSVAAAEFKRRSKQRQNVEVHLTEEQLTGLIAAGIDLYLRSKR